MLPIDQFCQGLLSGENTQESGGDPSFVTSPQRSLHMLHNEIAQPTNTQAAVDEEIRTYF